MVLIERIFYEVGAITFDFIYFSVAPSGVFVASKCTSKLISYANRHALVDKSIAAVSDNLFECLQFLE